MKILIPSRERATTITTCEWLHSYDKIVCVHTTDEATAYRAANRLAGAEMVCSHAPLTIGAQRDWMLRNLVAPGEWYLMLDDNVRGFTGVNPDFYHRDDLRDEGCSKMFQAPVSAELFLERAKECRLEAEKKGAELVGFGITDNWLFRTRKWRDVGFVLGKATVARRNVDINYNPAFAAKDDYAFAAEHLKLNGRVLINNFLRPVTRHFARGGIGSLEAREPLSQADAQLARRCKCGSPPWRKSPDGAQVSGVIGDFKIKFATFRVRGKMATAPHW